MTLFALAAALATFTSPPHAVRAAVQATATIRVISGVELKLDGRENQGAPRPRASVIKASDGTAHPAKLIEFQ